MLTILGRLNALVSVTEINSLYDQRSIVEKQASYAFVHPFAEALGGMIADLPIKLISAAVFNVVLYFLGDLVRKIMCIFLIIRNANSLRSATRHLNSSYFFFSVFWQP
jgi:ABC-type multidrug transport system permease subunit